MRQRVEVLTVRFEQLADVLRYVRAHKCWMAVNPYDDGAEWEIHFRPEGHVEKVRDYLEFQSRQYRLQYDGIDGDSTIAFTTLADAALYLKERYLGAEYIRGGYLQLEQARLHLRGFSWYQIGELTTSDDGFDFHWDLQLLSRGGSESGIEIYWLTDIDKSAELVG